MPLQLPLFHDIKHKVQLNIKIRQFYYFWHKSIETTCENGINIYYHLCIGKSPTLKMRDVHFTITCTRYVEFRLLFIILSRFNMNV